MMACTSLASTICAVRIPASVPVEKIHNQEIGFKYQADWVYVDVSAYHRLFYGVPYTYTDPQGQQISLVYGTNTKGVNLSTTFKPFENFTIALSGDYMDGHYTQHRPAGIYRADRARPSSPACTARCCSVSRECSSVSHRPTPIRPAGAACVEGSLTNTWATATAT